ncbi:unnamed protein product [Mytilus coruscus]|uniref:Endonuclease/exonuclease/phosphatase domain-containing protein n=1 Tax=Mytilus coruscus TaxID=42192 RepID=A0A6J8CPV3_MYTCO|nr:unnamed protein product [Mytilus coruscus]
MLKTVPLRTGQQGDSLFLLNLLTILKSRVSMSVVLRTNVTKEFNEIIINYDIFICTESKIDNFDVLNVPEGYSSFSKCRKQFAKKSGGITVIFKNELKDILNFQNTDCEFVLWVEIENIIEQKHLLLGCIYIPPENSKYSSQESDQIEGELLSFKTESTVTALTGDFNARSSTLTDYIVPDDKLMRFLNIDEINDVHNYLYEFQKLQEKNIPVERSSEDRGRCNNYGYKMLNFCKNNSIFIANGRSYM